MKKVTVLLTMMLVVSIAFMSFKAKNVTRYGGTASVTVKVGPQSMPNCMYFDNAVKEGQTRVIEVSTSCTYSNSTAAKEDLQRKIGYEIKCYEKATSSIDYDIDTCD